MLQIVYTQILTYTLCNKITAELVEISITRLQHWQKSSTQSYQESVVMELYSLTILN